MAEPQCSFSTAALYPRDSADSLSLIARAGFGCAELMPQCFADAGDAFAARAGGTGVRIGSVHYPLAMFGMLYNAHSGMCAEARGFGRRLVRLCTRLGASVLVIHPHDPPKDPASRGTLEAPIVDTIVDLAEACCAAGVTLAMENCPKGPGRDPASLLAYLAFFAGRARIFPMVDTTEAVEASVDPAVFIAAVHPVHVHLSDHAGEAKHLPAGEGSIDWTAVRRSLAGYRGLYTLEPSYRHYLVDPEPKLERALAFVARLAEGGVP
jgi:sugar phosphate isomerase/epimerase